MVPAVGEYHRRQGPRQRGWSARHVKTSQHMQEWPTDGVTGRSYQPPVGCSLSRAIGHETQRSFGDFARSEGGTEPSRHSNWFGRTPQMAVRRMPPPPLRAAWPPLDSAARTNELEEGKNSTLLPPQPLTQQGGMPFTSPFSATPQSGGIRGRSPLRPVGCRADPHRAHQCIPQ